ncbi:hypothetical protein NKDENANG_03854 [Candidatus Entotheonellaceae bacterium PAL068K]
MNDVPTSKEAVVLKLLEEGDTLLCLDARGQGVRVPPEHAHNPDLHLILNLNFPRPIDVTAEGISATLSFAGRRFLCYVPMQALWGAFNPQTMQGMMWPDSMPPEVLANLAKQPPQSEQATTPSDALAQPERPQIVREGVAETPEQSDKNQSITRRRGHLRVIK